MSGRTENSRRIDAALEEHLFGHPIVDTAWPCGTSPDCCTEEAATERPTPYGWYNELGPVYAASPEGWPPHKEIGYDGVEREVAEVHPAGHYSTTGDGMLAVIEAMREKSTAVQWLFLDDIRLFVMRKKGRNRMDCLYTPLYMEPEDVALAACRALDVDYGAR